MVFLFVAGGTEILAGLLCWWEGDGEEGRRGFRAGVSYKVELGRYTHPRFGGHR